MKMAHENILLSVDLRSFVPNPDHDRHFVGAGIDRPEGSKRSERGCLAPKLVPSRLCSIIPVSMPVGVSKLPDNEQRDISLILKDWSAGNRASADVLLSLVYEELRKIARQYLRKERLDHTLQPTALVHEAYMKLIDLSDVGWQDRAHFFAVASNVMRHILVDYARARLSEKRGGDLNRIALEDAISLSQEPDVDVLLLDEALKRLAEFDEQQSRLVELRFFGGLTIEETAHVLGISPATVKREWTVAKAWLFRQMKSAR